MKEQLAGATSRNIWTGSVGFGLVQIPVGLRSATVENELQFHMLDRDNLSPIHNKRVNEKTGKEVAYKQLVKGYEVSRGKYVVMTEADFRRANVKASETLEIVEFVDGDDIDPIHYDKPYFLVPLKGGAKPYALLREALHKSGKVGIAKVVLRTRQHLAALSVSGDALVLNLLRFTHELRASDDLKLPTAKAAKVTARELKMADQLIKGMVARWKPEKFHDEFRDDLLKLIEKKRREGPDVINDEAPKRPSQKAQVIDLMEQLRKSMAGASAPKAQGKKRSKRAAR